MNLGKAIQEIRKDKNVSQGELAKFAAISQSYLSQVELNRRQPSEDLVLKLSEALNVTPAYIRFCSIEESDVKRSKREMFLVLQSTFKELLKW